MPLSTPEMASSQIPPTESRRESGLVRAFQKPSPKPPAMVFTLVDPTRSAAATRNAPPLAACRWCSARPNSPRSVVKVPGSRRSSSGVASGPGATCAAASASS